MSNYSETKKNSAVSIEQARAEYLEKLQKTEAFSLLKTALNDFENKAGSKPYDNLSLDASGLLVCRQEIYLDRELCQDEEGNGDGILAGEILESANPDLYYGQDDYSQGYFQWYAEICFGEVCIVNASPERNHYAVYSEELDLKINKIKSEEHGLMLVEQAMRQHGVYPWIVSADRCGSCYSLPIPDAIKSASDSELKTMIEKIESEEV